MQNKNLLSTEKANWPQAKLRNNTYQLETQVKNISESSVSEVKRPASDSGTQLRCSRDPLNKAISTRSTATFNL